MRSDLARWFARHRRDLPWRRAREPYAIWISESMLQQTRVETVVPYYERFLRRLPTIAALAAASEDEVVSLWSGLGYYRRARALRQAARRIVADHGGAFPTRRADVLALPGVGPYTAGAVLSIAFGRSEPIVDGNVARVFCRLFGLEDRLGSTSATKRLWDLARRLVPPGGDAAAGGGVEPGDIDPGDWNQALMELGALVCTPKKPRCDACPLASRCVALRDGRTEELPLRAARRAAVDVRLEVLLALRRGRVLLVRRPPSGRMAGMWELPTRELADEGGDAGLLWPGGHAVDLVAGDELGSVTHAITHHRIRARVRRAEPAGRAPAAPVTTTRWTPLDEAARLGLTGLTRKILARPFARAAADRALLRHPPRSFEPS